MAQRPAVLPVGHIITQLPVKTPVDRDPATGMWPAGSFQPPVVINGLLILENFLGSSGGAKA